MEYRASSTVYKKLSNARSFNDKSAYDGVFTAQSKNGAAVFSAQLEDYREIFGGSRVSSIPILDVPALNQRKLPIDVPGSKLEYSRIFGGFDELNFAMPYEELLAESKKTNSFSKGTRTSAGSRSPAVEHPSQFGKQNNISAHEASPKSFDRKENSGMSSQKFNQGSENGAKATAHVPCLHAVPGVTCLIDEQTSVQMRGAYKPTLEELNYIFLNNLESKVEIKPEIPISGDNEQIFRSSDPTECRNRTGRYRSDSVDKLFNSCEGDQGEPYPVTPPKCNVEPKFGMNNGFSERRMDFKSEAFEHSGDVGTACSPPYFEEVDVNSVAAASVAALRKAIDDAQERIKIAKESMEKRKAGRQKHKKSRSNKSLNSERKEVRTSNDSSARKEQKGGGTYGKAYDQEQAFAEKAREQNSTRECSVTPQPMRENLNAVETSNMGFKSTKVECWEEEMEEQFYEASCLAKDRAELEYEKEESAEKTLYHVGEYEWKGDNGLMESFENPDEGDDSIVVKEANERKGSSIKLSVVKGMLLSKLKSVLGVVEQEEDEINSGENQQETRIKAESFMEQEEYLKLPEELHEVTKETDEKIAIRDTGEINSMERQVEAHELVEEEVRDICQQEENETETKVIPVEKDAEKDEAKEQETNVNWINVSHDGEVTEKYKENGELEGNRKVPENSWKDEKIEGLPFQSYILENGCTIAEETKTNEYAEYESMVKVTPVNLSVENKLELADGLYEQHKSEYLINDQEASNFIDGKEKMEVFTDQPEHGDTDRPPEVAETSFEAVTDESEALKEEDDKEDKMPIKLVSVAENALKLSEIEIIMESTEPSPISDQNQIEFDKINIKLVPKQHDKLLNGSSIFCNLGNAEGLDSEMGDKNERNIEKVEVSTYEEDNSDLYGEEILNKLNNIEAGHPPCILEGDRTFEVAEEETITSSITGMDENPQATMKMEDSEIYYVLEKEMQLEYDGNNIRDKQSGMNEINHHTSEIVHEIKTSQIPRENDEIHQATQTEDETASDSSDKKEQAVHWENMEEDNLPGIFRRKENLENIDQEIRENCTSQTETQDENHQSTQTLDLPEINVDMQGEAEIESQFNYQKVDYCLSQEKDTLEESAEILTNESVLEHEADNQATLLMEEKVANMKLDEEAEVQKEQQRKIDEVKEKERERERIAVERAIREARGRAFAEARERAAADPRRRVTTEARERSVKLSVEANDKPTAEKVSMEARVKAQRAAVERATAEARERALEKAMSERAIYEARNLADKIVAERLSSGDCKMKKSFSLNDSQPKGSCSSSNFRHANSFNLGDKGPNCSERNVGSAGESPQRCKARLERHQRTVERVAKALAEKNIRDLLSQREQEERNRIADALDVEVKRWSSGKEGNLRALLSTLQYILGPDSGWQPIPLTDIFTTTAVKKAYRRATLSVHPDKLQQRGANIQQKYICEKVFDLLKAAWNKFNLEER